MDYAKQTVDLIKNGAPWIDPARMRPMQLISYEARDGSTIEGLLVLPENADSKHPAPLIVQLHEGPWHSGNYWGWDAPTQFFASRGYAVFKPNYRGSQGYDSRFASRDRFDFQKMSHDVTDGVRSLIKGGLVDSKRIAIGGFGFGGYLAICGVVDEPDLYRCAYTYGGIFDWEKAFKVKDSSTLFTHRWLQQKLSEFQITPPSPLGKAAEIRVPVFFTRNVGIGDITFQSQGHELYVALRRKVECVNFGDLNLIQENDAYLDVIDRYTELENFFAKHLAAK
jgi:dipeptidyl aminopeptidase/acylaminoacyl peptidase